MRWWHPPKETEPRGDRRGGGDAAGKHGLSPICAEDARRDVPRPVCADTHRPSLVSPPVLPFKCSKKGCEYLHSGRGAPGGLSWHCPSSCALSLSPSLSPSLPRGCRGE